MEQERENLKSEIIKQRPKLSQKSLTTYVSLLYNLYKKVLPNEEFDVSKFDKNHTDFLNYLSSFDSSKRKTYLVALFILTKNDDYRVPMLDDSKKFNDEMKEQKKSEKQKNNWLTKKDIEDKLEELKEKSIQLFEKDELSVREFQTIQNFIILCFMSGKYFAPRRSMDYTELKYRNYEENNDNCLIKNRKGMKIVFNKYKTAKSYGKQTQNIPPELAIFLNEFVEMKKEKYPENDYLLCDTNGNKLTPSKFTQVMYRIFPNKKASTNILRHSYVSEKYENIMPALKELNDDAKAMGHDLEMHLEYIKK